MSVSKTTKRTTRRSPASDIAASKAEAQRAGMRRYLAKACATCHHRIRLLPASQCERCTIVNGLDEETTTAAQRKTARNLMEAAARGPAAYRVNPLAMGRKRQAEEDAWAAQLRQIKERAQGAIGLFLAALEDEPELLRRACLWAPGASHPWSRDLILLMQDVRMFADVGAHLGTLADAVEAHLAGDPIGTAAITFLTGIEWKSGWVTPRQFEEARNRATETERHHQSWEETRWGGSAPGEDFWFVHVDYRPEDRELVARYKREQQERLDLMDAVYRSDLRRWERGVDTLDRDHPDYKLALDMKPKAPEGYYGRIEAKKRAKTRDARIAAIFRRAEKRRTAAAQPTDR